MYADALDGVACDVSRAEELEGLWSRARSHGPIDIWINNAGMSPPFAPLWEISAEALKDVIDTNIRGVLLGSWVALRGMREQKNGVIYNLVGFGVDGHSVRGALGYGASKRAVGYISKALTREARECSVRVCTIDPGAVRTDMTDVAWYGPASNRLIITALEAIALDPLDVARLLAPRILNNRRNGARIWPWNIVVTWARTLFLPLWAILSRKRPRRLPAN